MDWLVLSGLIGTLLPAIIELFAKSITGRWKIVTVWGVCLFAAVVQTGADGGFVSWNWSQFGGSFVIILVLSVKMWKDMWKKWFPGDSDPYEDNEW